MNNTFPRWNKLFLNWNESNLRYRDWSHPKCLSNCCRHLQQCECGSREVQGLVPRPCLPPKLCDDHHPEYDLGSISPIFYEQLFLLLIPKVKKILSSCQSFLHYWDLRAQKMLVKCLKFKKFILKQKQCLTISFRHAINVLFFSRDIRQIVFCYFINQLPQ